MNSRFDFRQSTYPGGKNNRFFLCPDLFKQWYVIQVHGSDFECRDSFRQKVNRLVRTGGREENKFALTSIGNQFIVVFIRKLVFLNILTKIFVLGWNWLLRVIISGQGRINNIQGFEGLKFHGIRPRLCRHGNQILRLLLAAVVIHPYLGDDKTGLGFSD